MEESLDADTLFHLLDDDFDDVVDFRSDDKQANNEELLDTEALLELINKDDADIVSEKESVLEKSIAENSVHVRETRNDIQDEMLRLQQQLNMLQEKLNQKNVAKNTDVKAEAILSRENFGQSSNTNDGAVPVATQGKSDLNLSRNYDKVLTNTVEKLGRNIKDNKSVSKQGKRAKSVLLKDDELITNTESNLCRNLTAKNAKILVGEKTQQNVTSSQENFAKIKVLSSPETKLSQPVVEAETQARIEPIQVAKRLVDVPLALPAESGTPTKLKSKKSLSKIQKTKPFSRETNDSLVHTGLTDSSDDECNRNPFDSSVLSEEGRQIKKRIAHASSCRDRMDAGKTTWKNGKKSALETSVHKSENDVYNGIRIINPLVSSSEMRSRMEDRKSLRLSLLESYVRAGDIEGDWVTMGVLIHKSDPKKSNKTGKIFSIWTLNDLRVLNKSVKLFLFGEVHQLHWKTSVATVIGILNASILPDRDGFKSDGISISVDHPGKLLMMGTAKDFGHCKAKKKDGRSCTMIVNVTDCAYCEYHVQAEYKKMSGKRMELQSMSGVHPKNLKNQILDKHGVMYGGQLYALGSSKSEDRKKRSKDKLTLESLKMKNKAQEFQENAKPKKTVAHLSEKENHTINNASTSSEFLSEKLCEPTAGSRNLLRHLMKEDEVDKVSKGNFKSITPKELLKMHAASLQNRKSKKQTLSTVGTPQLGRGFKPGDNISLDFTFMPKKVTKATDFAKLRAVTKLQSKGPIKQANPNAIKKISSPESLNKIQKRLAEDLRSEGDKSNNCQGDDEPPLKKNRLSNVDINSEKFQRILQRKSSHAHEVDEEEAERQEKYFHTLERKEAMEQKMENTKEITCNVVSCATCQYTAHQAADLCLSERHPLKRHKATKRFFQCSDCHHRTWAFTRIPSKACRNCGGSSFERTTMMKPKRGPQLENEKLLIRGDEAKFIK